MILDWNVNESQLKMSVIYPHNVKRPRIFWFSSLHAPRTQRPINSQIEEMDNYTTSQAPHKSASHKRVDCALLHQLLGVARSTLVREKLIFFDAKRLLSPQNRKYSALKAIIPYWQDPDEIWVDPSLLITMRNSNSCPLSIENITVLLLNFYMAYLILQSWP